MAVFRGTPNTEHRTVGVSFHCGRSRLCCARPLLGPCGHYSLKPLVDGRSRRRNLIRFVYFRDAAYVTRQGMRGGMTFKAQWYRDKFVKKRGKGFCG
jgi:hypothetical protein